VGVASGVWASSVVSSVWLSGVWRVVCGVGE
jgi:hypothetical protein